MAEKSAEQQLFAMRHSLAHIMATAIQELYPKAKFGVGPVVENGFYYDVDLPAKLGEEDLAKIEAKMREVIKADYPFEHSTMKLDEAMKYFKDQTYKLDLLGDLKQHGTTVAKDIDRSQLGVGDGAKVEEVGIYTDGPFTDLCRGPHVASTGQVGAFKLMRVSGAYWRGNENNAQLQRVYGVGFTTEKELDEHLAMLEEAAKRDHRKLGKELDLFVSSPLIGGGLPLFTPRGTVIREELNELSQSFRLDRGYQRVAIPHMAKLDAYRVSGHFEKFPELLRFTSTESGDEFALKPVNCPHHTQIYASRPRSYRDLPVKYLETTMVYRDEKSGELGGLSRVRAITQDDSHVFCREDQVPTIFAELVEDAQKIYRILGLKLSLRLSFRDDSDSWLGDPEAWGRAQAALLRLAKEFKLEHVVAEGEAAIYGPKMDFMATDALGRQWQLATVQLDYAMPQRFELEYIDAEGKVQRPVMVHCAFLGSLERVMSILIEHYAGAFPLWMAPEQVRLAPVNDTAELAEFTEGLRQTLVKVGLRVGVDTSAESVGKKIRAAGVAKVPYTLVLGEKERESGQVSPRLRQGHGNFEGSLKVEELVAVLQREVAERRGTSAL